MNVVLTTLNAKYIHTCLALRLLKKYAEPEFNADILEFTIKDPAMHIVSDLYSRKPDVIGFSCYIWNIEQTIHVIRMLKKVLPETKIVLGGPEVSYDTEYWLERIPEVDFIVIGEGEETFKHLLKEVEAGSNGYHFVFGLGYRKKEEIVINPGRGKLDLNTIPSPYRLHEDLASLGKRVTYFETSRGCPFSCQFCLSSIEVGVRYFDIERVKEDLLYLVRNGAKMIKFIDRTFNIKRDYALEIFDFLIKNHGGCEFQFEITADIMRPEVLEFLNENAPPGIFRFEIGVQSTNDATNDLIQRRQNFKKLARTVTLVKDGQKIDQHLDLIAGLPEEDYDSFKQTFNDVFALRPEELQLGFLKMLRGTGMRAMAERFGYRFMDNAPYEILSNNILSFDDIVKMKRVEDILEKYWNDHRMDNTMKRLTDHTFATPFDFFQEYGNVWDAQGWSRIGHQFEDLFTRLDYFLEKTNAPDIYIVRGLMKLDYLLHHKHKPRKRWWTPDFDKEEQTQVREYICEHPAIVSDAFADLNLSDKEIHKHVVIEKIDFNLDSYLKNGTVRNGAYHLIIYYNPKTLQAVPFTVPENAASDLKEKTS
ncbi:B12-binding domain-containing radical SAM protein [Bacillus sp. H-16]|uniref:B12-binding domain-containing radical SAM protein n=1 Tax=Alteribacter salitolerans TaxID=2912333 RepID=UPI00196620F5|nr:B12-binding domain-containing radical SAM protein [Alteribacter salitolerans]MBM7097689.1 B12-binding domain-containing radical SAM protein [Alteribacter salitolerans]